ncbi:pirin family protein [Paenibacillus lignilyticus]|uniref:pirin family protein n=1 Tax=Paenibacillus lignilyticus TaxID=1172615 RepID=UPI001F0A74A2|nr:pirin family protein [Paenibacillus lignilyticus]
MEILSIVLNGELRHEDSLGNVMTTSFGSIQRMSAGTGVVHLEHNPSKTDDVTFLQLWFEPERRGLTPSYEATSYEVNALSGRLLPIASSKAMENTVAKLHQGYDGLFK